MAKASEIPKAKPGSSKKGCGCFAKSLAFIFLALVLIILLGPMTGSIRTARELECMSNAMLIAERMGEYAKDHHGEYPTGKSSTEIFQKLLDGGYINDPYEFCWDGWMINGPFAPYHGKLKPEDICYDVTVPLDSMSPAHLPVVFMTGYKVTYSPGSRALPLPIANEGPRRRFMVVTYQDKTTAVIPGHYWFGFGRGDYYPPGPPHDSGGKTTPLWLGDNYVSSANDFPSYSFADPQTGKLGGKVLSDGTITNFIPTDFNPKGKKYVQLTPDGPLP